MHKLLCSAAIVCAATTAQAALITFENYAVGDSVTTIGIATFSSPVGVAVYQYPEEYSYRGGKVIGGANNDFFAEITITFSTPLSHIKFRTGGDDTFGKVASIDLFFDGHYPLTYQLHANADFTTFESHEFHQIANLTSIRIYDILDDFGLIYDNFIFTPVDTPPAPIPLPTAGLMLLGAVAGLGAIARRKRRA